MNFYTYIYFDKQWNPYYVGKGQRNRWRWRADAIPIPTAKRIQKFYFEHEWQAWECEIELIAFFGRQSDGGILLNKSTGGASGTAGVPMTEEQKQYRSEWMKQRIEDHGHPQQGKRGSQCHNSKRYTVTHPCGTKEPVVGLTEFCRWYDLTVSAMVAVSKGKRPHHKGFICEAED